HADGSGRVYPNFPDPALDDWTAAYHAGNYTRLAAVKVAYDPHQFFDFPQAISSTPNERAEHGLRAQAVSGRGLHQRFGEDEFGCGHSDDAKALRSGDEQ
ncbi:MAG: BBE domain-containing protein, partial [Ilumatobacteraceae bacterium]